MKALRACKAIGPSLAGVPGNSRRLVELCYFATMHHICEAMKEDTRDTPAFSVHLNAIRGSAAAMVFLAHAKNMFFGTRHVATGVAGVASGMATPAVAGIGSQAVIIFFVLSGYLVGGSVLRGITAGNWSWGRYLRRRLVRLWVVLIPALLIGWGIDSTGIHLFGNQSLYAAPPRATRSCYASYRTARFRDLLGQCCLCAEHPRATTGQQYRSMEPCL